jgi:phosphate acetyltransferase
MKHAFFLAPAGTGAGLTTVSLGLADALDRHGVRVAFFKPISQRTDSASGLERDDLERTRAAVLSGLEHREYDLQGGPTQRECAQHRPDAPRVETPGKRPV